MNIEILDSIQFIIPWILLLALISNLARYGLNLFLFLKNENFSKLTFIIIFKIKLDVFKSYFSDDGVTTVRKSKIPNNEEQVVAT